MNTPIRYYVFQRPAGGWGIRDRQTGRIIRTFADHYLAQQEVLRLRLEHEAAAQDAKQENA